MNLVLEFRTGEIESDLKARQIIRRIPGHSEENGCIRLELNHFTIKQYTEDLTELWRLVGKRDESTARQILDNGEQFIGYREFYSFLAVYKCNSEADRDENGFFHHCRLSDGREGWGCKHLSSVQRYVPHFQRRDLKTCWFDFGHFENELFIVHKDDVELTLIKEAESKYLDRCEHFSRQRLHNILSRLPHTIDPQNDPAWEIVYRSYGGDETVYESTGEKTPYKIRPGYSMLNDEEAPLVPVAQSSLKSSVTNMIENTNIHRKSPASEKRDSSDRNIPKTTFDQIGAVRPILQQIREVIELPLKRPNLFRHYGIKPHRGILLYGPPGCGKTMIARAIAHEVEAHFIAVNGPELLSKWYGQSEENLRELFTEARDLRPTVIFFDEIDSIAKTRASDSFAYEAKLVNQLLTLMDGIEENDGIAVIAATNRRDILDPALLRPGRFDYQLEIPLPDDSGILEILRIVTGDMPLDHDVSLESLVEKLHGSSGAHIAYMAREAAYNSMRRQIRFDRALTEKDEETYDLVVNMLDFEKAMDG